MAEEDEDEFVGIVTGMGHENGSEEDKESEEESLCDEEIPIGERPAMSISNPDVVVQVEFEEFYLSETRFEFTQSLLYLLGGDVDDLKRTFCSHVYYVHRFNILKRQFQMMLWVLEAVPPELIEEVP